MDSQAKTPEPPYYAVIFTNRRRAADEDGYQAMAARMMTLAQRQPGFLGAESVRDAGGFGITVSYWRDEESIHEWKRHGEHLEAQRQGREKWYKGFVLRVAKVERAYDFSA